MKFKNQVARVLCVVISYQMILTPVVMAQTTTGGSSGTTPTANNTDKTTGQKIGSIASDVIGLGAQAFSAYQGAQNANLSTPDIVALQQNLTPIQDKYFSTEKMSRVPGLMTAELPASHPTCLSNPKDSKCISYMQMMGKNPDSLKCMSMNTTLNDVKSETCRLGVTQDTGVDPNYQLQLINTYANVYSDIEKQYDNYAQQSNQGGQAYGLGCMEDAQKILQGYFDYRKKEMDNLMSNIEALNQKFKEAAQADLDNIEESSALLDGGSSSLVSRVKTAKPQLFDFSAQFNDPACRSMFAGENMATTGASKGLNGIQDLVVKAVEAPSTGKSGAKNFSGETYLKAHTSLVEDIKKLIDGVGKQSELNFSSIANNQPLATTIQGQSSVYGVEKAMSTALFADAQQQFTEQNQKLQTQLAEVSAELNSAGGNTSSVNSLMTNLNSGTFDSEVTKIQNGIENKCVSDSSQIDTVISKMVDPQLSSYGNDNAPSFIKEKLKQILGNSQSSTDKKLQELVALEKQGASRYYVKLDSSYEVQEEVNGVIQRTVVTPTTRKTPTAFLADVIKSCKAQFKSNTLETKYSGASAIAKLKELRSSYKSLAQTNSAKIKADLTKKLIDCDSNVVANQDNVASCSSASFDMGNAGFCANSALSCSKNMISCKTKAQKIVSDIKTNRQISIKRYSANVEKNKKDLIKVFDTALTAFKAQGTQLGAAFDIPWESPTGIKRELDNSDPSKYNKDLAAMGNDKDGKILLENPDAYVELLRKNVGELKESIQTQSDAVMAQMKNHIAETKDNFNSAKTAAATKEKECRNQYDAYVKGANQNLADANKKQAEDAAKAAELCSIVDGVGENPIELCNDSLDLSQDVLKAASQLGNKDASKAAKAYQGACKNYMSAQESDSSVTLVALQKACKKLGSDSSYSDVCKNDNLGKVAGVACETFKSNTGISGCGDGKKPDSKGVCEGSTKTVLSIDDLRKDPTQDTKNYVADYDKNCDMAKFSAVVLAANEKDLSSFGQKLGGYCSAQSNQQTGTKGILDSLGLGEKKSGSQGTSY